MDASRGRSSGPRGPRGPCIRRRPSAGCSRACVPSRAKQRGDLGYLDLVGNASWMASTLPSPRRWNYRTHSSRPSASPFREKPRRSQTLRPHCRKSAPGPCGAPGRVRRLLGEARLTYRCVTSVASTATSGLRPHAARRLAAGRRVASRGRIAAPQHIAGRQPRRDVARWSQALVGRPQTNLSSGTIPRDPNTPKTSRPSWARPNRHRPEHSALPPSVGPR